MSLGALSRALQCQQLEQLGYMQQDLWWRQADSHSHCDAARGTWWVHLPATP